DLGREGALAEQIGETQAQERADAELDEIAAAHAFAVVGWAEVRHAECSLVSRASSPWLAVSTAWKAVLRRVYVRLSYRQKRQWLKTNSAELIRAHMTSCTAALRFDPSGANAAVAIFISSSLGNREYAARYSSVTISSGVILLFARRAARPSGPAILLIRRVEFIKGRACTTVGA